MYPPYSMGVPLSEAVLALTPLIDELPGMQVPYDPLGTIRKEQGRVCWSMKRHGPVTTRHPVGTLHKHGLDFFYLWYAVSLLASCLSHIYLLHAHQQ